MTPNRIDVRVARYRARPCVGEIFGIGENAFRLLHADKATMQTFTPD